MVVIVKNKRIVIAACTVVVCVLALFFYFSTTPSTNQPIAQNGVLDLTAWDYGKDMPSMAGEWEFYWDRLYTYDDFQTMTTDKPQYVHMPDVWNSYEKDGTALPGFGYATYRLKVVVDDTSRLLSLRLDSMSTAYRLFIDGREIASNGAVGTDSASSIPAYQPVTVDFQPPAKEFYVIVQVSNFTYARGGIWYDIKEGTPEQIAALNQTIVYKDAILIGSLLIMALYYLSFYVVLHRDKSSLYFMLLCVIFIIRTSLYGDMFIVRLLPNISFGLLIFLTYATLYWIPVVIFLMVESIYKCNTRFNFKKAFVIYGIAATALTAVLPIHMYTAFVSAIEVIGIGIVVFSVGIVARAYQKREKGAGLILLAVFVILLTGIHDVLYQANVTHPAFGEMASIGIFLFMFTFSFIIASRLSYAYEKAKNLTLQLSESLKKERDARDELIKTELSFLRAQIKPHFLYNALSVISSLSIRNPQKAKELLLYLSDYLRGAFHQYDNRDGLIPLAAEIQTVRAYLAIEQARFRERLTVEYDIDERVKISIPILSIQPLVENAVRHGIMGRVEGGLIRLSVREEAKQVIITVSDNGLGMEADILQNLLQSDGGGGVGLKNIHKRMLALYGEGLTVESAPGKGTSVTFCIPV